jgi:hypothetical protein
VEFRGRHTNRSSECPASPVLHELRGHTNSGDTNSGEFRGHRGIPGTEEFRGQRNSGEEFRGHGRNSGDTILFSCSANPPSLRWKWFTRRRGDAEGCPRWTALFSHTFSLHLPLLSVQVLEAQISAPPRLRVNKILVTISPGPRYACNVGFDLRSSALAKTQ